LNKEPNIDLDKVPNIFDSPLTMKEWGRQFVTSCGNHVFNVQPNMIKIRILMERFVLDYNNQLEGLDPLEEEE
jgi:hypothetical protein